MSQVFSNGEVHPVYYKVKEVNGKPQVRRAPFDIMIINGARYISPQYGGAPDKLFDNMGSAAQTEDVDMFRGDFAYEILEPIVIGENEMGDLADNWKGLNAISNF